MPYGVSERMVESYGEVIWDLSLNIQRRRGDAVRKLDFAAIEAQREGTGLSDAEIAGRLGLAPEQVTFIRVISERRRFRRDQYRKLYALGGGKRYREGEWFDPDRDLTLRPEAVPLRDAMTLAPERIAAYTAAGLWDGETLGSLLQRRAAEASDSPAFVGDKSLSYDALAERVAQAAGALAAAGLGRGEVVGIVSDDPLFGNLALLACAWYGAVALPLSPALDGRQRAAFLSLARARLVLEDHGDLAGGEPCPLRAHAADPVVLLASAEYLVPHSHQTLLAAARGLAALKPASVAAPASPHLATLALALALLAGVPLGGDSLVLDEGELRLDGQGMPFLSCPEAPALAWGEPPVAPAGAELRRNNEGRIETTGPGVAPGYYDNPVASARAFDAEGWFKTPFEGIPDGHDAA